jgi:hypothetical protein
MFRNNVGQSNNWLRISLAGGKDIGRDAFSAVVRVKTSAGTLTKIGKRITCPILLITGTRPRWGMAATQ